MALWLVTGAGGFIGYHVARRLLGDGESVVGVDNLSPYYDPDLKRARVRTLETHPKFSFRTLDVSDRAAVAEVFRLHRPVGVIHLAAQAGVRHSLKAPMQFIDSNLVGFANVLEECRRHNVHHLVYASSSSVYGETSTLPFSVQEPADHPVSLYAATKRANELMAHSYSHLFGLPSTGLRFFSVYGPWGRPDMAYFAFADAMLSGEPILLHGDGSALRDFTFIDDVVECLVRVARKPPSRTEPSGAIEPDPATSTAPWQLFNVGRGHQLSVNHLIERLELLLGKVARRVSGEPQPADVSVTLADTKRLEEFVGFVPRTDLEDGLRQFTEWLIDYRRQT